MIQMSMQNMKQFQYENVGNTSKYLNLSLQINKYQISIKDFFLLLASF